MTVLKNASKLWKYAVATCLAMAFSVSSFAANLNVSGISDTYSTVNGTYVEQSGTVNGYPYWKHESLDYYIYYGEYTAGSGYFYWYIDVNTEDEDTQPANGVLYFGDVPTSGLNRPFNVTSWTDCTRTDGSTPSISIKISEVSSTPEINVRGNGTTIQSSNTVLSFADHTKFSSTSTAAGSTTRTYTIENTGNQALTIGDITLSGENASDFSITETPVSSVTGLGTTTFTVTFKPSAVGDRTATVSIVNSDSDESLYTFAISGYGFTPKNLTVSGSTLPAEANGTYIHQGVKDDFQYWKHATLNYYIMNYSANNGLSHTWVLENNFVSTDGYPFFCFSEANAPIGLTWSGLSFLPAGGSSYLVGTGTIVIADENAEPEINVKGNFSSITDGKTTSKSYDFTHFCSVDVATGDRSRTFIIENKGNATLKLTGSAPHITISGTDAADFSITVAPKDSLLASDSTTFEVTFNPSSVGTKTANISITSNDADESTYNFVLQGDGVSPRNVVVSGITTPAAANGTYICQGISNEFQYWKHISENYYLQNYRPDSRYDPVWYIGTDLIGTDLGSTANLFYSTSGGNAASPTDVIAWGQTSGNVGAPVVTFANPEIDITGNGISIADEDASPSVNDATDFDSTDVASGTTIRTFTIQNRGTDVLILSGTSPFVAIDGTNAADFSVTTVPSSSIAIKDSTTFQITFKPSAVGLRSATLSIISNDADESLYHIQIQGTGIAAPTVETAAVTTFDEISAIMGGETTADGGLTISDRGVVYSSTDATPTVGEAGVNQQAIGTGNGTYSQTITGLLPSTTYYVRAYVTNRIGTSYGSTKTFTTLILMGLETPTYTTITNGLTVDVGTKATMVYIFSANGKVALSQKAIGSSTIDVHALPKGVYVVKANGMKGTLKFVK
jgi:hypothetical protein